LPSRDAVGQRAQRAGGVGTLCWRQNSSSPSTRVRTSTRSAQCSAVRDRTQPRASQSESIPPPAVLRSECPPELERALQRALERDREQRWASARRFGEELSWMQARLGFGLLRRWQEAPAPEDPTGNAEWSPYTNKSGVRRRGS
jgi:hypothetical protein